RPNVQIAQIKLRGAAEGMVDSRRKPVQSPVPPEPFLAVTDAPEQTHSKMIASDGGAWRKSGSDVGADGIFAARLGAGGSSGAGDEDQEARQIAHIATG